MSAPGSGPECGASEGRLGIGSDLRARSAHVCCPYCGAGIGERCRTVAGHVVAAFPHSARDAVAEGTIWRYPLAEGREPCAGCGEPARRYGHTVIWPHHPGCERAGEHAPAGNRWAAPVLGQGGRP